MVNTLKNTSVQTFLVVVFVILFGEAIPLDVARGFYTLSLLLKDLLTFILPIAVCVFITNTLNSFEKKGWLLVLALMFFEVISNVSASFAAYGLSFYGASLYKIGVLPEPTSSLTPFELLNSSFTILRPSFWRIEYGTALGVIFGLCMPYIKSSALEKALYFSYNIIKNIFINGFAKIIPVFILGFFINLIKTADFSTLLLQGGKAIGIMIVGLIVYVIILYLIVGRFSIKRTVHAINNVLPAGLAAFSSMSSVATMPITIQVTEKNLKNPNFASMVIPATTNIQQVGDCFIQIFLCCMILVAFGQGIPNLKEFSLFLSVFVLARFTTAAVIGGAIFIMLPLYQTYLGFNEEMVATILMFNMILDPIVTSANVMANSALCVLFERFWEKVSSTNK